MVVLALFGIVVALSCGYPIKPPKLGTWTQDGDLQYTNQFMHMKLRMPDDKWAVWKSPVGRMARYWRWPTPEDDSYQLLAAGIPELNLGLGIIIDPDTLDLTLDDYMAAQQGFAEQAAIVVRAFLPDQEEIHLEVLESKVTERNGRTMGVLMMKALNERIFMVIFKEEGRFTWLIFGSFETLFGSKKNQFWYIIDSYEYLE
jgi:hypothetical protein